MADQMTVVAVTTTGHVLGAITRVAPAGEPTVSTVVGDAMPVRLNNTIFTVAGGELAVASVGFDARVFQDPRDTRVVFASPPDQDASLAFLISGSHGEVVKPIPRDTLTVKIEPASNLTADTPFWVLFQHSAAEPPVVVTGKIKFGASVSEAVAHGLTSGTTYTALVLLAGFAAFRQPNLKPP
jgi:hypothetical protein